MSVDLNCQLIADHTESLSILDHLLFIHIGQILKKIIIADHMQVISSTYDISIPDQIYAASDFLYSCLTVIPKSK